MLDLTNIDAAAHLRQLVRQRRLDQLIEFDEAFFRFKREARDVPRTRQIVLDWPITAQAVRDDVAHTGHYLRMVEFMLGYVFSASEQDARLLVLFDERIDCEIVTTLFARIACGAARVRRVTSQHLHLRLHTPPAPRTNGIVDPCHATIRCEVSRPASVLGGLPDEHFVMALRRDASLRRNGYDPLASAAFTAMLDTAAAASSSPPPSPPLHAYMERMTLDAAEIGDAASSDEEESMEY